MSISEEHDQHLQQMVEAEKRRQAAQAAIEQHQKQLLTANIWRSCLNCINWVTKPHTGCQKYRQLPPPEVIVHGCKEWEDDIPF